MRPNQLQDTRYSLIKLQDKYMKTFSHIHPPSSVVFLCFGSLRSFGLEQVREIALGLEASGHRFLWSLHRPPPENKVEFPSEYETLLQTTTEEFEYLQNGNVSPEFMVGLS